MIEKSELICYYMAMSNISKEFYEIFEKIEREADELTQMLSAVEVMSDHKLYNHYLKRFKNIENISSGFKQYKKILEDMSALEELLKDAQNSELACDLSQMKDQKEQTLEYLKSLYSSLSSKEKEQLNIEISSKEDADFVAVIKDVFVAYANNNQINFEVADNKDTVSIKMTGAGVYSDLNQFSGKIKKIERGVESHALVVVLRTESEEIEIREEDLEIQTSRSGGAGGQHINKTESAVKIIHLPTGVSAECQDERSQGKNKEKAMRALLEKIAKQQNEKQQKNIKNQRNELKNKIFASTPEIVFDFDVNKLFINKNKTEYKLREVLSGNLSAIINNQIR